MHACILHIDIIIGVGALNIAALSGDLVAIVVVLILLVAVFLLVVTIIKKRKGKVNLSIYLRLHVSYSISCICDLTQQIDNCQAMKFQ